MPETTVRASTRRTKTGGVVAVRQHTRRLNTRPVLVYRGMSSAEWHDWHSKGHVPAGKHVASGSMAPWAQEHSRFGHNDLLVAFHAPAGHLRPGGAGEGHWIVHEKVPIENAAPEVVEGTLRPKEEVDAEREQKEGAPSRVARYLVPGAVVSDGKRSVTIVSRRGRSYEVKVDNGPASDQMTPELQRLYRETQEARGHFMDAATHRDLARRHGADAAIVSAHGFSGEPPSDEELHRRGEAYVAAQGAHQEELARVNAERAEEAKVTRRIALRHFPAIFGSRAWVTLPKGVVGRGHRREVDISRDLMTWNQTMIQRDLRKGAPRLILRKAHRLPGRVL